MTQQTQQPDSGNDRGSDDSSYPSGAAVGDAGYDEAQTRTDQGVPVGAADAEEDARRASRDSGGSRDSDEDYLEDASADETTDQGVPVGSADVEADRRNAAARDDG